MAHIINGNPNFLLAGRRGVYWTGDPVNADQAYSFVFGLNVGSFMLPTVGNVAAGADKPKRVICTAYVQSTLATKASK